MIRIMVLLLVMSDMSLGQQLKIHGALKNIMQGQPEARFDLRALAEQQNIYGLGAVENLQGEIIVIDSRPYISMVKNDMIIIDTTFSYKAALFAFSNVKFPENDMALKSVDMDSLEKLFTARYQTEQDPLIFLLEGKVKKLQWHVIDWAAGDTLHSHQKHRDAGRKGALDNEWVTVVGFYSRYHKGVLTHRNSSMHLHFVNRQKNLAGHVDDLLFEEAVLKVANASH